MGGGRMPGNVRVVFGGPGGGGGGGMDDARAAAMFQQFFGNGDPFGGGSDGSDDDDFLSQVLGRGRRGGMRGLGGLGGLGGGPGGMGGLGGMGGMGGMGGGMPGRRAQGGASRPDVLERGTPVKLIDLSSAAAYNGASGTISEWDESRQRYVVALGEGGTLSVKPANVRQVVSEARVVGTSQPQLNGKVAAAATYDTQSKRYRVEGLAGNGGVVALKPENVVLPHKTRVTIDGVVSRPTLNGRSGRIIDVTNDRYVVEVPGEDPLKLRFGAVAAC